MERVLLIGDALTALAGDMPLLQRLAGRFTVQNRAFRCRCSDSYPKGRVLLAKKADNVEQLRECWDTMEV